MIKPVKDIIHIQRYVSPCGELMLGSFGDKLCLCDWRTGRYRDAVECRLRKKLNATFWESTSDILKAASGQLDEYFVGARTKFTVPLLFCGSDFQTAVWNELLEIPYGDAISYGGLARRLGKASAVRAVANANGANVISIFVPCHRVIGSDHSLTGYAGGLDAKRYLLQLESKTLFRFDSEIV